MVVVEKNYYVRENLQLISHVTNFAKKNDYISAENKSVQPQRN